MKKSLSAQKYASDLVIRLDELNINLDVARSRAYYGDGDYLNAINHYNQALRSLYRLDTVITDSDQKAHYNVKLEKLY